MRLQARWAWPAAALIVLATTASAAIGDVKKGDKDIDKEAVTGDLKSMQGTWTSPTSKGEGTYQFEGDKLTVTLPERKYVTKVKLDEKAKPHPAIDFKVEEGPDDAKGLTAKAIYKIEGDTITFCMGGGAGGTQRPEKFEQIEDQAYVFKLTKKKTE